MDQYNPDSPSKQNADRISRHEFIKRSIAFSGIAVVGSLFQVRSTQAEIVAADDPRIQTEFIYYTGATGKIKAYCARPKEKKKLPAVIVIHENRGLQPHIMDITRRMALEGFASIAPDALSSLGGTPVDADKARAMIQSLDMQTTIKNFVAAVHYLKTNPLTTGKVGCTGFCWGGAMTNSVAVNSPDLLAAVPYYGMQPALEDVKRITASLVLHYASDDERINIGITPFEDALKKASIEYTLYKYDGTQHAFNNDTNPERYNKQAAELSWKRTIAFFNKKLT